jgi:hypothetical protein
MHTAWIVVGSILIVTFVVLAVVFFLRCRKEGELGSVQARN